MQKKITMPQLKKIIGEELRLSLKEAVDHASIREVVNDASKLLAAVEAFKKSANGSMMNALTPQISDIEKVLEDMVSTPGSYVEKQKTKPQKVSLKPAKSGKTLLSLLSLFKVVVLELLQQNEGANNMAKKQTKQSLFKRLTRLFKSGPVIKKKIRNADTSIAVADKTKSSGTLLFQKSLAPTYATITANAYNLSERLMRYQDYQEMEMCISGDTKIAVPNGYKTIRELAEECENDLEKTFIVYSYDHNKGQIVPALGKQARQTSVDHAWKVTFDSGLSITTSAGHRLMLRDGTYRKLEELQVGDSMMPFYRKDLFSNENNENSSSGGYSWIYTMDSTHKSWTREHVLIAEWVSGRRLTKDECVHHINFVRSDNRPENLLIMNKFEHSSYHAKINNEKKWHVNNKEWIDKFKKTHSEWMKVNNPAERRDVTFGRILETCEKIGFNQSAVCSALDVSVTVIQNRLKKHGFSSFELFAKTYCNDWKNSGWNNSGENNPRFDKTLTFACICNAYTNDMSAKKLADMLGTTVTKIMNRIRTAGYKNYSDFSAQFTNHKIESIEYVGVIPLYDLTVDGYKNFATDSVVSHNTPEISSALDIYADETVAADEKGRALHIYSDNERVKEILEDLFYGTLNLEFNLRSWARNLVKYGDFFLYNDVSDDYGVVSAFPIPVNEIEREENYDREDPFAVRYRWVTLGNRILENWEVSHFRLLGNDMFLPYGSSVIEPARRIWRQLILIEDAMLVYRVVRAPERRVFYIDVGNIPASEVELYVEQQRKKLRTNQVIDSNTGRVDLRYNPMSVDEDYLMPVRGAESGTKIETLAGGQNTAAVEDVAYIQKKLFAALKIPRAYLGYDEALCLDQSTSIPLYDGRTLTIEEIATEFNAGKQNWTYTIDSSGKHVPGKIIDAWKTKDVTELYHVTLDNGHVVKCTANHPFMLRDGTYRRADELKKDDSLMPVYRKFSSKSDGDFQNGYEKILNNNTGRWEYTHRLANEAGLVTDHASRDLERSYVIHHIDHDKRNNNPTNLIKMGKRAHILHHSSGARANLLSNTARVALRETMKTQKYIDDHLKGVQNSWDNSITRRNSIAVSNSQQKRVNISIESFNELALKCSARSEFYKRLKSDLNVSRTCFVNNLSRSTIDVRTWLSSHFGVIKHRGNSKKLNFNLQDLIDECVKHKIRSITEWRRCKDVSVSGHVVKRVLNNAGYKDFASFAKTLNHQIVNVELVKLDEPRAVYDLTIEGNHNFAIEASESECSDDSLSSMIVVHNSSKATLAQEDIRFSRTISVIQKTIISELNKLAIIHLYAHGFDGEDLQNFTLRLSNPSTVAQQQKLELWRAKFEIAGSAPEGFVDKNFIRKEIWGLNEEQCKAIDDARLKDKIVDSTIEGAAAGEAGAGGGDAGVDDLFGGDNGGEATGGEEAGGGGGEETPPEENAGEEPEEEVEPDVELLTSADSFDDEVFGLKVGNSVRDVEVPVKAQKQLDRVLYNRGRLRTHGASKTFMPDLEKMTSNDEHESLNDPFDSNWMKSVVSNPFGESRQHERPIMTSDMMSILRNWSVTKRVNRATATAQKVITESNDDLDVTVEFDEVFNDDEPGEQE